MARLESAVEGIDRRLAGLLGDLECLRERRREVGRTSGRERDEEGTVVERIDSLTCGLEREACLPDTAGAGEGDDGRIAGSSTRMSSSSLRRP